MLFAFSRQSKCKCKKFETQMRHKNQTKPTAREAAACARHPISGASKPDGGISPVAAKPPRSTAPSVLVHFPLGRTTWLSFFFFFFLLLSHRVCVSSSHQMLLPPLIPSQELKPPSEAAKRPPPGAPGRRRAEVSSPPATQQVLLSGRRSDPMHRPASREIQGKSVE